MTLTPYQPADARMQRFRSLQAGQYWRANQDIPEEGIREGLVLLIQSIRWVDGEMHTVILRPHPELIGKRYEVERDDAGRGKPWRQSRTYDEHRFLVGDFENLFTWEPEARQVRDAELRAVQDRVNALQSELLEAQRDPTAMDEAVEEALREEDARAAAALPAPEAGEPDAPAPGLPACPGDGIDVVAMSTGNMVDAVSPGLTREGVERMKAAARREHRIATVRASWIQERTTAIAETIQQMTPFYQEQAAAALAATEEVRDHVAKLVKGIATLDLYVGDGVRVHTIREGEHAPRSEPLTFVQRKLVMAEELAVWTDVDEWFDFDDTERFHQALRENDGLVRQVFPTERCVLVMATTRESVDYKADAYTSAVRNVENKKVFLLVRDGMNVHRVDSPVESHMGTGRLFPTRAEVDAPFRGWDGSKVRFEDVAFTDSHRMHENQALHYKRFLVLACGLDHRLKLFGDFYDGPPSMGFVSQEFQDAHCRFLHDDDASRMLGTAGRPSVSEWIASRNAYLRPGSRVLCSWRVLLNPDTAPAACKRWPSGSRSDGFDRRYSPSEDQGVRVAYKAGESTCVDVEVNGWSARTERTFNARVDLDAWERSEWRVREMPFLCLDAVAPGDVEFYIHNRGERRDHIAYIRFFKRALAFLKAEREAERDSRERMLAALAEGGVGTPETRPGLVDAAVIAWRAANRGAPLPDFAEGKGTPWREMLDQMFALSEGGARVEGVERFVRGLGLEPLRLVMTGKGRLSVYAAPAQADRDDRIVPHAHAHLITLSATKAGYAEKARKWAILPRELASETALHEWPEAAGWADRENPFGSPEAKAHAFSLTEGFAGRIREITRKASSLDFEEMVRVWSNMRDRINAKAKRVQNPKAVVPFGVEVREGAVRHVCLVAEAHVVLHRVAPDEEARHALRRAFVGWYRDTLAAGAKYDRDVAAQKPWDLAVATFPARGGLDGLFAHESEGVSIRGCGGRSPYTALLGDWFRSWASEHRGRRVWLAPGAIGLDGELALDALLGNANPEGYEPISLESVTVYSGKGNPPPEFKRFFDLVPVDVSEGRRFPGDRNRMKSLEALGQFGYGSSSQPHLTRASAVDRVLAAAAEEGLRAVRPGDLPGAPEPPEGIERWYLVDVEGADGAQA